MSVVGRIRFALKLRTRLRAPVRAFRDLARGRTSLGDREEYLNVCAAAARDESLLTTFKRHPAYVPVLEHLSAQKGAACLELALAQTPALEAVLDRVRRNDELGSPNTADYGPHGAFSPTTLRYLKVASDLLTMFGPLDGMRIAEIGGGYGGQCFVVNQVATPASYTMFDLPAVMDLQRVYLDRLGVEHVEYAAVDEVSPTAKFDLLISNFAFSECTGAVQRRYLDAVLKRSARGYVTCNFITPGHYRSLGREQLLAAIPGSQLLSEQPPTAATNALWAWGG